MMGMDDFMDEIALMLICTVCLVVAHAGDLAIVGCLAAFTLISICNFANAPVRIASQIAFYGCALFMGDVASYLPVAAYLALHERTWAARTSWAWPLAAMAASTTTPAYPFALPSHALIAVIALCIAAALLAIRDIRERQEREGYRNSFDDARASYLSLTHDAHADPVGAKEADPVRTDCFSNLTERERAVARLVAQGQDNRQIASELFLSEGTVRNHISSILSKKDLTNRTQIAVLYYRGE